MKPAMAAMERHSWGLSLPRSRSGMLFTGAITGADKADLLKTDFAAATQNATLSHMSQMRYCRNCFEVRYAPGVGENQEVQAAKVSASGSASRVQAALSLLRDRHERVTRARQAVIEVLDGTQEH
ncbi:MAG TPA: hypothetical protein VFP81_01370, partial [Propionibacteriaceae bacterium]|nr:hypothetical protein [Propionibacteriaceae bacterium]